jgi:hypothetical protein
LLFLRDVGDTEVGGFGICPNELLLVEDIQLVDQTCTCTTVKFHDDAVANFFDEKVDTGLQPEQFARIWIHTHPGDCAQPSLTDEDTFDRVFRRANWAVMFILACGGDSFARLRFNEGPRADILLPASVDFNCAFSQSDFDVWEAEYEQSVTDCDTFVDFTGGFWSQDRFEYLNDDQNDLHEDTYLELMERQLEEETEAYGYK